MTEEEYFRKNYPNFCYGDRPLSPYWDLFQDGVEFGERQSETKIEELEKENAKLREKLNKIERKCKFNFVDLLHDVENESKQEEQLTKAKEIIREIMKYDIPTLEYVKAEQFLKENGGRK